MRDRRPFGRGLVGMAGATGVVVVGLVMCMEGGTVFLGEMVGAGGRLALLWRQGADSRCVSEVVEESWRQDAFWTMGGVPAPSASPGGEAGVVGERAS